MRGEDTRSKLSRRSQGNYHISGTVELIACMGILPLLLVSRFPNSHYTWRRGVVDALLNNVGDITLTIHDS